MTMLTDKWGRTVSPTSFSPILEFPDEALMLEPRSVYDQGLIGTVEANGNRVAVYNRQGIISALQKDAECESSEAEEWVSFNTEGAYAGPYTPIIIEPENSLVADLLN